MIWQESNHYMAEGTKPELKPAKCFPLPGKENLNEKTEGSNGTGHSLEEPAQVFKIDLLLEVGNIWDPEKRTMGTVCCELQIEKKKFWILHIYRWQKLLIQLWGTTKKDLSATPTDPPHTHTHSHTHTYITRTHTRARARAHTHTHPYIASARTHTHTLHKHTTHTDAHTHACACGAHIVIHEQHFDERESGRGRRERERGGGGRVRERERESFIH